MKVLRPILAILGVFFLAIGVPLAMITPFPLVPIGLPVVILGVVLVARNSVLGRRWMKGIIDKHPKLKRFAPMWLLDLIFTRDHQKD